MAIPTAGSMPRIIKVCHTVLVILSKSTAITEVWCSTRDIIILMVTTDTRIITAVTITIQIQIALVSVSMPMFTTWRTG